jgi:ATP-dependent Lon protease
MAKLKYKSTADIKVPKQIVEQVIGQDEAVEVIRKAAQNRRHVLLIGEPGTGKSMLGLALAELLPMEKLVDIISFPNPNDENTPLVRTLPAGQGRDLVTKARMQSMTTFKNQNIIIFILVVVAMFAPWWVRSYYKSDIMFAAFFLGGMLFLAAFIIFLNLGKRVEAKVKIPKVIVDNFKKKQANFNDATGAHAGALLGDVLHDPFQTFFPAMKINKFRKDKYIELARLDSELDLLFNKHRDKILKNNNNNNNYEAIHLPKNELYVLGETKDSVSPVEVLSINRYDYDGKIMKLTTSENRELIVTPEHKIAIWKNEKITYIEAKNVGKHDQIVWCPGDIMGNVIIDEQDIVGTYDEKQQEQCRLYNQYLELKSKNPDWSYKRIAKAMGQTTGKIKWWHYKKHVPVPIQTANWLKGKCLLPLKIDNPKLPLISKVLGATFGDGGIFKNLNGVSISSSEKEAVKEFGRDLDKIFALSGSKNSRVMESGKYGRSWIYQNTNGKIIRFLLALGAPKGSKSSTELNVPGWVGLKKYFEDEFYGSFIGGALKAPIMNKNGNCLTALEVGITGSSELKANRTSFLNKSADYLKRNRIDTVSIYKEKTKKGSLVFKLAIDEKIDNVILFLMNVKINYCKHKVKGLHKDLGQWSKLKIEKYHEMVKKGYGAENAMRTLNLTPNSLFLLLNHFGTNEALT